MKKEQQMQMEKNDTDVVKKLRRDILLLNIMMFAALVLIGFVCTAFVNRSTSNASKIAEIAQKTGVECTAKTNTIFGIQKITIVK